MWTSFGFLLGKCISVKCGSKMGYSYMVIYGKSHKETEVVSRCVLVVQIKKKTLILT